MSKDIKTKNTIKDIKAIDKAAVAGERIRNVTTKTKDRIEESTDTQYSSPHEYATTQVSSHAEHFVNKAAIEAKIQTQQVSRYARDKIKTRKEQKEGLLSDPSSVEPTTKSNISKSRTGAASAERAKSDELQPASSKIKTKEPIQKDIKTTDRRSRKSVKRTDKKSVKTLTRSGSPIKESSKATVKTSQELAKQSAIKSAKTTKESYHTMKTIGRKSYSAVKKTTNATRHAIQATKTAITFLYSIGWIAILVILLIALIGGIFMTGSSNSGEGNQLSPEVIAHTSTLQKYADEYEIPHFLNALQAIMMQESGGKGNDPMQSSECAFNTKFPNTPNGITDPDYSIKVGVQNFAECLKQAKCTDPLDIPSLSLALQGYNFGNGYIAWALKNFGAYSQGNAKVFSDDQARKHGWSSYGDPEYVPHVLRYYQFAGLGTSNSKLVNIASSQIGNHGGTPYWSWYGYKERVEWCACFVSWVAYQSGDLDVTIPKFAAVVDGVKWYKDKGQWQDRRYIPKSGDIIFFDWEVDGTPDHVGIVEKSENGIVYTIEGNSNDQCRQNTYVIDSKVVYGYGVIN
ncbi:lysozyme family protein [Clostridia bacterium UC5.1-2G4]|uniref:lysozyme family protein n=1 Tax=Clostridium innocuum TaxID=1522 RepID=UPI0006C8110E|nr:CHAP domain-containing protein [Clostridioides difficile]